jgi:hypothetical protein
MGGRHITWDEECSRRRREHLADHARTEQAARDLTAAIDVGDAGYQRLRRRLDAYGTRLDAVRAGHRADVAAHASF